MSDRPLTDVVTDLLVQIMPELGGTTVPPDASLEDDLGANSIDRADLVQLCLETLKIDRPMSAFAHAHTIAAIAAVLERDR